MLVGDPVFCILFLQSLAVVFIDSRLRGNDKEHLNLRRWEIYERRKLGAVFAALIDVKIVKKTAIKKICLKLFILAPIII